MKVRNYKKSKTARVSSSVAKKHGKNASPQKKLAVGKTVLLFWQWKYWAIISPVFWDIVQESTKKVRNYREKAVISLVGYLSKITLFCGQSNTVEVIRTTLILVLLRKRNCLAVISSIYYSKLTKKSEGFGFHNFSQEKTFLEILTPNRQTKMSQRRVIGLIYEELNFRCRPRGHDTRLGR